MPTVRGMAKDRWQGPRMPQKNVVESSPEYLELLSGVIRRQIPRCLPIDSEALTIFVYVCSMRKIEEELTTYSFCPIPS